MTGPVSPVASNKVNIVIQTETPERVVESNMRASSKFTYKQKYESFNQTPKVVEEEDTGETLQSPNLISSK